MRTSDWIALGVLWAVTGLAGWSLGFYVVGPWLLGPLVGG